MIIIHALDSATLPRRIIREFDHRLRVMRAVLDIARLDPIASLKFR